nr:MAG TPA: hypothetical protein [Caudoviricetes sp.]
MPANSSLTISAMMPPSATLYPHKRHGVGLW